MKIELQVERLYNKGIDGKGSIGIVLGRLLFYKKGMIFNQLIIVLVIEFLSQNPSFACSLVANNSEFILL